MGKNQTRTNTWYNNTNSPLPQVHISAAAQVLNNRARSRGTSDKEGIAHFDAQNHVKLRDANEY